MKGGEEKKKENSDELFQLKTSRRRGLAKERKGEKRKGRPSLSRAISERWKGKKSYRGKVKRRGPSSVHAPQREENKRDK